MAKPIRVGPSSRGPFFTGSPPVDGPVLGVVGPAEYQWGTHAAATYNAEGLKSGIFNAAVAAAVAVTAAVPVFVFAPQQAYADVSASFVSEPLNGSRPQPIKLFGGAPQADPTQQFGWIAEPTAARQGGVPSFVFGDPQDDPSQVAARLTPSRPAAAVIPNPVAGFFAVPPQSEERPTRVVWQSQRVGARTKVPPFTIGEPQDDPTQLQPWLTPAGPAVIIVPNPIAGFFAVPPQNEERPTRAVWPSQRAGKTPAVIALTTGAPQLYDFTQQAVLVEPSLAAPVVSYAFRSWYAAPQLVDLTQQGWIRGAAPVRQAKVPSLLRGGQPQFNPYQIPADLCMPLEFGGVQPVYGWGARTVIGEMPASDPFSRVGTESVSDPNKAIGTGEAPDAQTRVGTDSAADEEKRIGTGQASDPSKRIGSEDA